VTSRRWRQADVARLGVVRSFQLCGISAPECTRERAIALQRKRGSSFDFWRSKRVLEAFNEQAMKLIADVDLSSHAH